MSPARLARTKRGPEGHPLFTVEKKPSLRQIPIGLLSVGIHGLAVVAEVVVAQPLHELAVARLTDVAPVDALPPLLVVVHLVQHPAALGAARKTEGRAAGAGGHRLGLPALVGAAEPS